MRQVAPQCLIIPRQQQTVSPHDPHARLRIRRALVRVHAIRRAAGDRFAREELVRGGSGGGGFGAAGPRRRRGSAQCELRRAEAVATRAAQRPGGGALAARHGDVGGGARGHAAAGAREGGEGPGRAAAGQHEVVGVAGLQVHPPVVQPQGREQELRQEGGIVLTGAGGQALGEGHAGLDTRKPEARRREGGATSDPSVDIARVTSPPPKSYCMAPTQRHMTSKRRGMKGEAKGQYLRHYSTAGTPGMGRH